MADAAAGSAVVVPIDGFHFSNAALELRGLAGRKGAPDTYDVDALVALLVRLREPGRDALTAPAYSRDLHEPVKDAIAVPAGVRVVIVEGNYLGLLRDGWERVRPLLDDLWFLDVPWAVTRARLIARRVTTGRDRADAVAWVDRVDRANDEVIRATSPAANRLLTDGETPAVP